jgi:hypothetical protein
MRAGRRLSAPHSSTPSRTQLLGPAAAKRQTPSPPSPPSIPNSFSPKVGDFGLSIRMDPGATHISNLFQGTMTHMSPETLDLGRISPASDVGAAAAPGLCRVCSFSGGGRGRRAARPRGWRARPRDGARPRLSPTRWVCIDAPRRPAFGPRLTRV